MNQTRNVPIGILTKNVHQALKMWYQDKPKRSPLHEMVSFKVLQRSRETSHQTTNQLILNALDELQKKHPSDTDLLRRRFIDRQKGQNVANYLNVSESQFYLMQKAAIGNLAQILNNMEREVYYNRMDLLDIRLPPSTYRQLLGVQNSLDHLRRVLTKDELSWVLCISGMGGIGKTSLADALVRQMIYEGSFVDVGWVSAQKVAFHLGGSIQSINEPALTVDALVEALVQQLMRRSSIHLSKTQAFDALQKRLKERAHLIVIDNLETLEDVQSLLPALGHFVNPTKFILTSRRALYEEPNVYHFKLPELSPDHTLQLIQQEARRRNLPHLLKASDSELRPIYNTVGGNPLALRLIVGQANMQPLKVILDDLAHARGETVENLYTYIYQRAWEHLDEATRRVLLFMPLAAKEGAEFEYLEATVGIRGGDLRRALNWLVTLNLVDLRGNLGEQVYTIHNLTRSFLQEQVIKWT